MLERFLPRSEFTSYEDFVENYSVTIPERFNFGFDVVDAWAKMDKNKRALVWCDDHGGEKILTFEELRVLSNKTANFLRNIGVRKGSVVMVILRRRWEYWVCATALCKLGAIIIPATIQLTAKDIEYRVTSADIDALICVNDDFVISQVEEAMPVLPKGKKRILVNGEREGWLCFDKEMEKCSADFSPPTGAEEQKNEDIMLIYFTSGTTGMPKMVKHNFLHPLGQIVTAKYWQKVQENKLHLTVSDSGWAKFGWGKIYGQWLCGAVIFAYDMDKFVPANLLRMIGKYRVTTFCAPVTMYRFMLQEDLLSFDLSSVERYCMAGEPLNPEVFKKWKELTGLSMVEGFGQTESTVLLANFDDWFPIKPGSTGKPSPLYKVKLLNEDGWECEDGEEGEIVITDLDKAFPVGLFRGYMDKAPLGGPDTKTYGLGDMAWRDSDGYFWFVGRNDDVIKCSGYRIGPFEVESALLEHPAVVECAVTAAPDPTRGQVVKATVVLAQGHTASKELIKELQDHVKKVTAPYKYPRIVEFVSELPKTIGGKIKRAEIRSTDMGEEYLGQD
ncbi:MAG: AMP-binding protein [Clostridiales bacterium]|nr:AMP-binding protein [Clostridiales bacterium]